MKKQKIQLIILMCALVLCIVGYLCVRNISDEDTTEISESISVTSVTESDVTELQYLYQGETIDLVKEDGTWYATNDKSINLLQSDISTMLSYICNITTETMIAEPTDLEAYGLNNPTNTISLTLSDGSIVQLLIGNYQDMTGEYYAMVAGDPAVYLIANYIPTVFEKSVEDLIEPEESATEESTMEG